MEFAKQLKHAAPYTLNMSMHASKVHHLNEYINMIVNLSKVYFQLRTAKFFFLNNYEERRKWKVIK